jgi:site-specific recombinase XerD
MVLDNDYLPVEPIQKYLHYLDSLERSPNTIATYAHNLKLFWEFLEENCIQWQGISLDQLSNFIQL